MSHVSEMPRGTVTFLFTDIEGSTRLWRDHEAAMQRAYARHDAILTAAIARHGGVRYKVIGDAYQVAFPTAPGAVAAALEAQQQLCAEDWAACCLPEALRVRMALHAGAVDPDASGDYRSPVLNRLGRLLGVGSGEQVLLSQAVAGLVHGQLTADAELLDLGAHRLKDLLEPEHIWQLTHPGLHRDFPPIQTLDRQRHNLPVQPTPFIGRENEVAAVVRLLRESRCQLVTLTGPGGTGKTRLSLQVASELVGDYPDGVWFVALAPLADPAHVPGAIASAIGVREAGDEPMVETLTRYLSSRSMLLVLDNVEHLLTAAPVVGELLAAASGLQVLASSRAPLRLRVEREYPVATLTLPRRQPPPTLEQLTQYEAVRLFIDRAVAVKPDFVVTNESAPAVAEICHRLDGLPLAIELAAARIRMLTPQAMLSRLEQRLPLLTGGARDVPARQQTLRSAIAWSDDLLDDDDRRLFRRLSVFAGGWTLEASEAVAGSDLDVFNGLERLVEHSLVRQDAGGAREPRFSMLETIREYGLEHLGRHADADGVRDRHALFFMMLAQRQEEDGGQNVVTLDALSLDHDNIRAALSWTIERDPEIALRISGPMSWYWQVRCDFHEGLQWLQRSLAATVDVRTTDRVKALVGAGALLANLGKTQQALDLQEQAIALAEEIGDRDGLPQAIHDRALAYADQGRHHEAIAELERCIALSRERHNDLYVILGLCNLGYQHYLTGDYRRADTILREGIQEAHDHNVEAGLGAWLHSLASNTEALGDHGDAFRLYQDALSAARTVGDKRVAAECLRSIASLIIASGDLTAAARFLGAVETMVATTGAPLEPWSAEAFQRDMAALHERLPPMTFDAIRQVGSALSFDAVVDEALQIEYPV